MAYVNGFWVETDIPKRADLEANGMLLQFVPLDQQVGAQVRYAVANNGLSLQFARKDLVTRTVARIALAQNPFAIAYAPFDIVLAREAINASPLAVFFVRLRRQCERRSVRRLAKELMPELTRAINALNRAERTVLV